MCIGELGGALLLLVVSAPLEEVDLDSMGTIIQTLMSGLQGETTWAVGRLLAISCVAAPILNRPQAEGLLDAIALHIKVLWTPPLTPSSLLSTHFMSFCPPFFWEEGTEKTPWRL